MRKNHELIGIRPVVVAGPNAVTVFPCQPVVVGIADTDGFDRRKVFYFNHHSQLATDVEFSALTMMFKKLGVEEFQNLRVGGRLIVCG
jgi:hypothetical protein